MQVKVTGEVILDTLTGQIMKGARGQSIFDKGKAAKSANHTGWWREFLETTSAIEAGYKEIVDNYLELKKEWYIQYDERGYSGIDDNLDDAYLEARNEFTSLFGWGKSAKVKIKKIPFKDNKRYVIKTIESVTLT